MDVVCVQHLGNTGIVENDTIRANGDHCLLDMRQILPAHDFRTIQTHTFQLILRYAKEQFINSPFSSPERFLRFAFFKTTQRALLVLLTTVPIFTQL